MENPRRSHWNPILKDCRPCVLVRLSVSCEVVLSSMEGKYPLLPNWLRPVKKNVPNPPFEFPCGTPCIPNCAGIPGVLAFGCVRVARKWLYPKRNSFTRVVENVWVSLRAEFQEFVN